MDYVFAKRRPNLSGSRECWGQNPGGKIKEENACTMKNKEALERLMSERWPKLKKRAQREKNPEKLIAILEEIDDLLFTVEMRIAARSGRTRSKDSGDSRSDHLESGAVFTDDSEIGSP
jgi:hypothetical protein